MSLWYTHLLIPASHDIPPSPNDIARFLGAIIELGVLGDTPEMSFCTLKRKVFEERTGRNPVTGQVIVIKAHQSRWPDRRKKLENIGELAEVVADSDEYQVDVAGCTVPKVPPLPIDFADPYHLTVSCQQRSRLVSTSNLHGEATLGRKAVQFSQECTGADSVGLFTHPETLATIEVPGAGCARFWIEFRLGKFLFPIMGTDIRILNPQLLDLANRSFQLQFVQGFYWG